MSKKRPKYPAYPGVDDYKDRHGRKRFRFRAKGFSRELGTDFGSPEFVHRYKEALEGNKASAQAGAGASRTVHRSINHLIVSWYKSADFVNLKDITKATYRSQMEPFRERFGDLPADRLDRKHLVRIMGEKADTPAAANNLKKRLAQLLDHAVDLGWRTDNPARTVKSFKLSSDGYHTWDEGEIARFFAVHPKGSLAHTAVTLMLYTGASRADVVRLGRTNLEAAPEGTRIEYRRQKMNKRAGVLISIPLHPDLAEVIDALPATFTFLQTAQGRARSPDGLGNSVRKWCNAAGLSECSAHGLRKACARRLAEAGATSHEIMAVTGHKSLAEAERYTAEFDRAGSADKGMAKLISRPNGEQRVANLPSRFAKKETN